MTTVLIVGAPLVFGAGATLLLGRRQYSSPVPGLLFHSVLPRVGIGAEMSHFPLDRFETLCEALALRSRRTLTISEASGATVRSAEENNVLLTFDDGLQCVYRYALPALDRWGLKTTVFCVAGQYGKESAWDIFSRNRHLTAEEIRGIAEKGHEIGSHTCTHAYLPYLDDRSVRRELSESKRRLEDITGKPVTGLSFPFGGWNRRIWETAREIGYRAATLYRGYGTSSEGLFPVAGVYRFDSVDDVLSKITPVKGFSPVLARTRMMSHFALGTPIWKYRKEYIYV